MSFFNWRFDNGVNKVLSWFGINLLVSLQDITQSMFWNLAKISFPADLKFSDIDGTLHVYCAICYYK